MDEGQPRDYGLTIDNFRVGFIQTVPETAEIHTCMCQNIDRKSHLRTEAIINPVTDATFILVLELLPGFRWSGSDGIRVTLHCWTGNMSEWAIEVPKKDFVLRGKNQTLRITKYLIESPDSTTRNLNAKNFRLRFTELKANDRKPSSHDDVLEAMNRNVVFFETQRILYNNLGKPRKPLFPTRKDFVAFKYH